MNNLTFILKENIIGKPFLQVQMQRGNYLYQYRGIRNAMKS